MKSANKAVIHTKSAPAAVGPYSQAVSAGNVYYISGQLPINPTTGELAGEDIQSQTEQSLKNIQAILESSGLKMDNVVKTTVYLQDMNNFSDMNDVYARFFNEDYPARVAFQVVALPKNALVEIEAVAVGDL